MRTWRLGPRAPRNSCGSANSNQEELSCFNYKREFLLEYQAILPEGWERSGPTHGSWLAHPLVVTNPCSSGSFFFFFRKNNCGHPDSALGDFGDLQRALFVTVSGLFGKALQSLRQLHYY